LGKYLEVKKMAGKEKALNTKEWTSVSVPMEYIDFILEALKQQGRRGCVSEFVRDAVREKLADAQISAPKYDTLLERYEKI
jgi:Arc/MetJ-type ribon-helix-helix transcriptional regulator